MPREGVRPMGRGRAKAKQTKVARQLKYSSQDFDVSQLAAELGASDAPAATNAAQAEPEDPYDPYADYADADKDNR